jgi:vitamin B12 transporter
MKGDPMKRHPWAVCVLSSILFVARAWAQEELIEMEPVVVTTTKIGQPISEAAASVTVITEEEIETTQARDVSELLRLVPGLTVSQSGDRGGVASLFVRGGESDHVLVLVDGVQVNEAGGAFDASLLSTENIGRVEIVRGPQSSLYGSEAVTAVVQIFTKKGEGDPSLTVSTAAGRRSEDQHGIYEQQAKLSGEGFSLAYGRTDDGGILPFNNRFFRNTFSGRMSLTPDPDLRMDFTVRAEDKRSEFPTEGAGDRLDAVFPGLDPDQFHEEDIVTIGFQGEQRFGPSWTSRWLLGLTDQDRLILDPPNPEATAYDGTTPSVFRSDQRRFTGDYLWRFLKGVGATTVGMEYETEELSQVSTSDFGSDQIEAARNNRAYYLLQEVGLADRFFLTAGVRAENNSLFGTDVNPKGSAAYLFREWGLKLRSSVGTGIKNPTFTEQFGSSFSAGNTDLDPEQSISWDAGLDQSFGRWGSLGVTYFNSRFRDLIAYVYDPLNDPDPDYFNIQAARSRGVEAMLTVMPVDRLVLKGGVTYLSTEVTDDGGAGSIVFEETEPLLRRPRLGGSWAAQYRLGNLSVGLDGRYVGKRDDVDFLNFVRVENPSYVVWDGRFALDLFGRKPPVDRLRIFGRVQNLFDKEYEDVFGYSSPRRSYVAGLEVTL